MTVQQYRELYLNNSQTPKKKPKSKPKYGNKKEALDGYLFDSQKEMNRYCELKIMLRAGLIRDLRLQVVYELMPSEKLHGETRAKAALRYIADFVYFHIERGQAVIEDVKSRKTAQLPAYRQKKHAMKSLLGLDIEEV